MQSLILRRRAMRWRSAACVVLVLGGLAAPAAGQEVIGWKFTEGETFYLLTDNRVKSTMRLAGQNVKSNSRTTTVYAVTVNKPQMPNTVSLTLRMESVHVSADGQLATAVKALEQMEGGALEVTLGPDARVLRVEGFEAWADKLKAKTGLPVKSAVTEDALRSGVETIFTGAPGRALTPGDRWEIKTTVPVLGPLGNFDAVESFTYRGKE